MGLCKRVSNPKSGTGATVDVDQAIATCDLYLMDIATEKLLPNRKYRIIDGITGNTILGTSDADAKISNKFRHAYVEVLPVTNKKYLEDVITAVIIRLSNQAKGNVIEVEKNLLMGASSSTSTTAPIAIGTGVNVAYMDWLEKDRGLDPWTEYSNATSSPYTYIINKYYISITTVTFSELVGSPSVPNKAKLIDVNKLMANFSGSTSSSNYKFLNLLQATYDPVIVGCFIYHITNGTLPTQYYYVLGHGAPTVIQGSTDPSTGKTFSAPYKSNKKDLNRLLSTMKSKGYKDGQTVVFLACHLGNGEKSFAEKFSELKDVGTVYAFTGFGWFSYNSSTSVGYPFWSGPGYEFDYEDISSGSILIKSDMVASEEVIGHWRIFNTATAVKKSL